LIKDPKVLDEIELDIFNKMKERTKAHRETSAPLNMRVRNFDKD